MMPITLLGLAAATSGGAADRSLTLSLATGRAGAGAGVADGATVGEGVGAAIMCPRKSGSCTGRSTDSVRFTVMTLVVASDCAEARESAKTGLRISVVMPRIRPRDRRGNRK